MLSFPFIFEVRSKSGLCANPCTVRVFSSLRLHYVQELSKINEAVNFVILALIPKIYSELSRFTCVLSFQKSVPGSR